jgi:hypothetical protein
MRKCLFVLMLSFVFIFGCVAIETTTGRDFDASKVSQIQIGKTTQREILTMFGQPESRGIISGNTAWRYEYQKTRASGSLAEQQAIKSDVSEKTLAVIFKDGVVKDYNYFEK